MTGHAQENMKKIKGVINNKKLTDEQKDDALITMISNREFKGGKESLRQTFKEAYAELDAKQSCASTRLLIELDCYEE